MACATPLKPLSHGSIFTVTKPLLSNAATMLPLEWPRSYVKMSSHVANRFRTSRLVGGKGGLLAALVPGETVIR
jgi:hypothetical protein